MEKRIFITGTGGQGVMLIGKLLTYGAFFQGEQVLFYPTYGGEQRGGASNCAIMMGDERIGAPNVRQYDVVVFMNQGVYNEYRSCVRPGGIGILNTSLIDEVGEVPFRKIEVNAVEEAAALGSEKAANMVILGALVEALDYVEEENVVKALHKQMASKPKLWEMNEKAIQIGRSVAEKALS